VLLCFLSDNEGQQAKGKMMTRMTLEFPDELAERVRPLGAWLPTVLELSLVGFTTLAVVTAGEVIEFLSRNPSPAEVLDYRASERSQDRLRRLLALNEAGLLGEIEQRELSEIEQIEHVVVMLKVHATERVQTVGVDC
jgi:hypothetical protein